MSILLAAVLFRIKAYTNKSNRGFYLDNNLQLTFANHTAYLNVQIPAIPLYMLLKIFQKLLTREEVILEECFQCEKS